MTLNLHSIALSGFFIIAFLICSGCTQTPLPAPVPTTTPAVSVTTEPSSLAITIAAPRITTKEEMVAFVQEAVTYAHQNGKEKSLQEFSNRNGSFFRGELYIYAYDQNGITIAHPVNPEKIGVSRLNERDAKGNLFIQDLRQAAVNGTGFVTYYYINPTHNNTIEKKLGYAMSVDPTWWLGSGIYQDTADTPLVPLNRTSSAPAGVAISQDR